MPKFKIEFEREYTVTEGFTRVIEADTREDAMTYARELAGRFDSDCPDGCSESGAAWAGEFDVSPGPLNGELVDNDAYDADYVVGEDDDG